jgi:hypothetical protein
MPVPGNKCGRRREKRIKRHTDIYLLSLLAKACYCIAALHPRVGLNITLGCLPTKTLP